MIDALAGLMTDTVRSNGVVFKHGVRNDRAWRSKGIWKELFLYGK